MASTTLSPTLLTTARTLHATPWCTDYEKMVSGMLYNSLVPELTQGRFRARQLCHSYNTDFPANATAESLEASRFEKLKELLGSVGDGAYIEPPFRVDYGSNVRIGKRFYANFNLTILDCSIVTIGHRVMLGPNVSIFAATHETSIASRRDYIEYAKPVTIGDDCWIGGHVCIMPGVTIGRGVTVAAGSVVTRDVEDFVVVMGVPARVVRRVEEVERLPGDEVEGGDGGSGVGVGTVAEV